MDLPIDSETAKARVPYFEYRLPRPRKPKDPPLPKSVVAAQTRMISRITTQGLT